MHSTPESRRDLIRRLEQIDVTSPPLPPSLPPESGRGSGGGMEPWQQSVESRLTSLDNRLGKIEPNIADIKTDLAVLKATAATKADLTTFHDKMLTRMQIYLAAVGALIVAATAVTKFW